MGSLHKLVDICSRSIEEKGKLLFFGNGGSAADAQHLAAELTIRFRTLRPAIGALALTTDTSAITAAGNDLGFEMIFSRQLEAIARAGDVAIGITTSGRSQNVLRGLETARRMGLATAMLTGSNGAPGDYDVCVSVPSLNTARIQEMHITLGHLLCAGIEERLGHA
jgi:D-sedoheptulose 7-phosphate isomerase